MLYCLNATTGASVWNFTTGAIVLSSPAVALGHVFVGCDDHKVYCLDATTGAHVWNSTTGDHVRSSPAVAGGRVYVNGQTQKPGYRLKTGDVVDGRIPAPQPAGYLPEPIPLHILYEDADIVVISKPPGLVVHPSPGHASGTLVNGLLHHCPDLGGIGAELRFIQKNGELMAQSPEAVLRQDLKFAPIYDLDQGKKLSQ